MVMRRRCADVTASGTGLSEGSCSFTCDRNAHVFVCARRTIKALLIARTRAAGKVCCRATLTRLNFLWLQIEFMRLPAFVWTSYCGKPVSFRQPISNQPLLPKSELPQEPTRSSLYILWRQKKKRTVENIFFSFVPGEKIIINMQAVLNILAC